MKKIVIMRHAHAQPTSFKIKIDKDRPLSIEGLRQLDQIRYQLGASLQDVSLVLCSNAKRTRQTLEGIRNLLPERLEIIYQDTLYNSNLTAIVNSLKSIKENHKNVLLVAHNPSVSDFFGSVSATTSHDSHPGFHTLDPATMVFYKGFMDLWKETTIGKLAIEDMKTFSADL